MRLIATNGIQLAAHESGPDDGLAVVLCHGFPELAYSWRHQMQPLADAGFHALALDLRGYGSSDRPEGRDGYDLDNLSADVIGVLDALAIERAVLVGHDWGAPLVWRAALRHPDRVRAVAGLSVPHAAPSAGPPLASIRAALGPDAISYFEHFQAPGVADAEWAADVRRMWLAFVWSISGDCPKDDRFRGPWATGRRFPDVISDPPPGEPTWLTVDDIDAYVTCFEITGFSGGLSWYRNMDRNWEQGQTMASHVIEQPSLFIAGTRDPARGPAAIDRLPEVCSDLRGVHILDGCGHWTQQEFPGDVNRLLLDFLGDLDR